MPPMATVFIRISALGTFLIFGILGRVLIRRRALIKSSPFSGYKYSVNLFPISKTKTKENCSNFMLNIYGGGGVVIRTNTLFGYNNFFSSLY